MGRGPAFTAKEDAIILREVCKHPENIHKCFINVSEKTGRSVSSVECRYYRHIKPKYQGTPTTGKRFSLNGQKEINGLIKNIAKNREYLRQHQTPVKKSKMKAIWNFIVSMLSSE